MLCTALLALFALPKENCCKSACSLDRVCDVPVLPVNQKNLTTHSNSVHLSVYPPADVAAAPCLCPSAIVPSYQKDLQIDLDNEDREGEDTGSQDIYTCNKAAGRGVESDSDLDFEYRPPVK